MLQCGDRVLIHKSGGMPGIVHNTIGWWLNSEYGHISAITNERGDMVSATVPRVKKMNLAEYFNGSYNVLLLTPANPFSETQKLQFGNRAESLVHKKYDYLSYFGFVTNQHIDDKKSYNCSELVYTCDKDAGLFPDWDGSLVSPQSYYDFFIAGMFNKIFMGIRPTMTDFHRIVNG